jgi:RNA polymerase sigma factor (sigma-70 family)
VSAGTQHEDRFRRAYAGHFALMLAYAVRRVDRAEDAADVVSEIFLVAWRRRAELPPDGEIKLWLYGVARRVLANHRRGHLRRERLSERLRHRIADTVLIAADPGPQVTERLAVRAALARLGELDREVLTLTVWEGLSSVEAAEVLDLSPAAVRIRLFRARARLRELISQDSGLPGQELDVVTKLDRGRPDDRRGA